VTTPPTPRTALRCLPRKFVSKQGQPCGLQLLPPADGQSLIDMYLAFQPRNCFQGLPPIKDAVCVNWVQQMLRTGVNVIALCAAETIVGHTALFPINQHKCEMLVVVCPGFQNVGIGTELVRTCIDLADELGFERIWLPVDATNVRARHVYRKCGFEYVSNQHGREMDMACQVRRWRRESIPAPTVPAPCFPLDGQPLVALPEGNAPFIG
jgi:RimJ/RimL family protein N-acetyltransferase